MKSVILIIFFLLKTLFTDAKILLPGAELLFKGIKTKLSVADKNDIFLKTGYYYSKEKKGLFPFDDTLSVADTSLFKRKILPTDINNDGVEEIFIIAYINADEAINAFIKRNGKYVLSDIFYYDEPYFLDSKNYGYYDIASGDSYYRFDGSGYKPFKGQTGKKLNKIEEYSHNYTSY